MVLNAKTAPITGAVFASLDESGWCHSVLGLDLPHVEDVRELGEESGPQARDPQLDDPLVGDLLPDVRGVELRPQRGVLVGQLAAVAGVDAVRPVVAAAVLPRHVTGCPVVVLVGGRPVPPDQAPTHHDTGECRDGCPYLVVGEPRGHSHDDDGDHHQDDGEDDETGHSRVLSEGRHPSSSSTE